MILEHLDISSRKGTQHVTNLKIKYEGLKIYDEEDKSPNGALQIVTEIPMFKL